jgi:Glycosyltransferase family 87
VFTFKNPVELRIRHIYVLYLIIAIIASIQCYYGFIRPSGQYGRVYPNYNNYIIFKNSFFHLIQGKELYIRYPDEQWDLYKYSPTFSLFFGLFAYLPDFIGLLLWNLLNSIPLLMGIVLLKGMSDKAKIFALLFCFIELMGSLQTAQSNGLTAALLILTFASLENGKYLLATFFVAFSLYLKIYGGIGLVLFIFYPAKARLFLYTFCWTLLLGLLPLAVVDLNQLFYLYKSWGFLLKADQANSTGISVMGILQSDFKFDISNKITMLAGIILFLIPLLQTRKYKIYEFRLLVLSSMLIWVVIFNYKAESSTYIIAICGIAIWFFSQAKTSMNCMIIILTFVFTILSPGDLFPHFIKGLFIRLPYLKAIFPILIFGIVTFDLFKRNFLLEESSLTIASNGTFYEK